MMVKKNDIVTVEIEDMSSEGQGIGIVRDESTGGACGFVLFIKDTVIGDVAEVKVIKTKKSYGYARMVRLIMPSKDRVEARCPVARQCGGCQLQEMNYAAQLIFKQNKVKNNLKRIGGLSEENKDYEMLPIIGMDLPYEPFHYRNKAQFPVGADKDGNLRIGFYAGRTHDIIECEDCCIGAPVNAGILAIIRKWMLKNNIKPYDEANHSGLIRHVLIRVGFATGQICVCLIINSNRLDNYSELVKNLSQIAGMTSIMVNFNRERSNVILGNRCETLWGTPYIEDCIGSVRYRISPLSFYQVNPVQTKRMYDKVIEFAALTGSESVWDLYCGIGTIALYIAGKAKQVYGVEIVPQAIEDAKQNARLNNIENAEFFVGRAEEVVPRFYEEKRKEAGAGAETRTDVRADVCAEAVMGSGAIKNVQIEADAREDDLDDADFSQFKSAGVRAHTAGNSSDMLSPDVIIVDPPRKGCDAALLDTMLLMVPSRIVYVSCDSATLARDLKYLTDGGDYKVEKVQCYDNFCQGVHVETIVLLSHK